MASITINIPDGVAGRVLDAVAARYNWQQDSGLTKAQFAKSIIVNLLKDTVKMHEGNVAAKAATATVEQAVESEITIT
jgi:hypothetical protein